MKTSGLFCVLQPVHLASVTYEVMECIARIDDQSCFTQQPFALEQRVIGDDDHRDLDRERLLRQARLIVDTRDALRDVLGDRSKVYGL